MALLRLTDSRMNGSQRETNDDTLSAGARVPLLIGYTNVCEDASPLDYKVLCICQA